MVQATVALRIDVDTHRGLLEGVPRLLDLLHRAGVQATFCVTMGPDRSGLAIRRAWRPGFLAKMWRTRALRLYGLRTLLSGTLLPARPVGAGAPGLLAQIAAAGHELVPHGWDHVGWQDRVHRMDAAAIRADLARAAAAVEAATGVRPQASAAPGWRTTGRALAIQEELGLRYASDVRGAGPFRPRLAGGTLETVQLPTTAPTLDELLGRARDPAGALAASLRPGLNVLAAHAEVEGGALAPVLEDVLARLARAGIERTRLCDAVERLGAGDLPAAPVAPGRVAGRSGWVAMQGAPIGGGGAREGS